MLNNLKHEYRFSINILESLNLEYRFERDILLNF